MLKLLLSQNQMQCQMSFRPIYSYKIIWNSVELFKECRLLLRKVQNMFAHWWTVPAFFLRWCFSFFILSSLLLSLSFLSLLLLLCFLFRLFLFSRSWTEPETGFLSCILPTADNRAFCISVEDPTLLFPSSIEVPFPFLIPERNSFFSDFPHGWLVSICEWVL